MARPTWEYETDRATIVGSAIPDNLVIDCSSGQLEALLADGPRLPGLFARSLLDAEYVHIAAFSGDTFRPFTFWLPDDLQTSWLNCVGR